MDTDLQSLGWLIAIVTGGLTGWLAAIVVKGHTSVFDNLMFGVSGALIASVLPWLLGAQSGGLTGYVLAGCVGACVMIAVGRRVFRRHA